jgi:hypothetical protein
MLSIFKCFGACGSSQPSAESGPAAASAATSRTASAPHLQSSTPGLRGLQRSSEQGSQDATRPQTPAPLRAGSATMSPRGATPIDQSAQQQPAINLLVLTEQYAGTNPETPQQTPNTSASQSPRTSVYLDADDTELQPLHDDEIPRAGMSANNDAGIPRAATSPNLGPIHLPLNEQPAPASNPQLDFMHRVMANTLGKVCTNQTAGW